MLKTMLKSKKASVAGGLSAFTLMMLITGSIDSIRNLPATALFGSQLIFFFIAGAIFFLIPCALVSAELASGWPKQGGVYIWVKEAFGSKVGFLAIWLQWIENVIWYPTLLSFVAGSIGYLIDPQLAESKAFLISIILCSFWGTTFINLLGMKSSAWFSSFCGIAGLFLPMTLIISLGAAWLFSDNPLQIEFTKQAMLPHFTEANSWVSLTGIMLSFCGIEIATVHARDVVDPQRAFPRALLYSVIIILTTLILGSLAIALVIPVDDISLVAGIMQAFDAFFSAYNMRWILPVVAFMLVLGGLASVNNWIIAPTKGLLVAAQDGSMPAIFHRENRHGAPVVLLMYQAVIVSLLTLVFLLIPSVNGSYWFLTALAAQLYMVMYIIMFITAIYLRYKFPHHPRAFSIPGGNLGMWIVSVAGIIGCSVTIAVSFIPPPNTDIGSLWYYEGLLITGFIIMCLPPFISYYYSRYVQKVCHLQG